MWRRRLVGLGLGLGRAAPRPPASRRFATYPSAPEMAGVRVAFAGGVRDLPPGSENDPKAVELSRFAVAERNNKTICASVQKYAPLEFVRLVKVSELVVAGMMHYFVIEVKEGGRKELYQAKVWEKAWENFKQLQGFKRYYNRFNFYE